MALSYRNRFLKISSTEGENVPNSLQFPKAGESSSRPPRDAAAPTAACSPGTEGLCKDPPAQWGAQVKHPATFPQMATTPSRVHGPRHCAAPRFNTGKSIFPFDLLDSPGDRKPWPSKTGSGNERHFNAPD